MEPPLIVLGPQTHAAKWGAETVGEIGLGGEQCEEGDRIVRRTLAHVLNLCTVDYTESM